MFELLVVFALSPPPPPTPPLRLADLLEEARRKNPAVAAAREQARGDAASVEAASAIDDPMVMVQLWNMPVDLSTVPLMVNLTQTIPLGGKRAAKREEAEAMARASRAGVAARARDVEDEVARAYFDLYLADRTIEVDGEIVRTLETLISAASARIASGRGEEADVLRAESEKLKVESDREAARGRRAAAVAKLVALLDRPPDSDLGRTEDPGLVAELPASEVLRARALRERPELLSANAATSAAEARLRLAHAQRIPDLTASAGEMHMFGGMASPSDFLFLGLQVNLPIFGGKNGSRIGGAEAGLAASRAERHALENRVFAEVADALAEVQAETRQAQLHHQLIPLARQALSSALASYSSGRGAFSMVLDAERDLEMHELDLATHVAAYSQRLADLERAVGGDLGLSGASATGLHVGHEERSR
jgi:outer membrane protein, heavy metal efflux system